MNRESATEQLFLAIDQGGQSSRVAIYDSLGQQLCCFSSPCATRTLNTSEGQVHIEQDGEQILAGIRASLRRVEVFLGARCENLIAGGFAGQGSSLLCWHSQTGAALSPIISWQDRRAEILLENFPLTQNDVQQSTGLRISPHYGASKMRWCLDHLAPVQAAAKANNLFIGPIVSYLFWHLLEQKSSGVKKSVVDPGHAQRSLLWNLQANQWDKKLLSAFNIPDSILPGCLWHNSYFGDLRLGGRLIPFVSCQRDQGASLFARGLPRRDVCYINIGTGAFIQRISEDLTAPEGLLVSPLWLVDKTEATVSPSNLYAWEATVNGAAAAINWLENEIGSAVTPARINAVLSLDPAPPTSTKNLYLLNALGGLGAPYWRSNLTSHFSGDLTADEKILAWIESVIFQLMINFKLMQLPTPAQSICISGGLSRADGLCQRMADLTGLEVWRSEDADATLQGVAYTTASMPGTWSRQRKDDFFQPRLNPSLHHRFLQWQMAMDAWLE